MAQRLRAQTAPREPGRDARCHSSALDFRQVSAPSVQWGRVTGWASGSVQGFSELTKCPEQTLGSPQC